MNLNAHMLLYFQILSSNKAYLC